MTVNVSEAWDQVIAQIAAQFPDHNVKAGEDASREKVRVPAILVDLTELEPDPEGDRTTGEWPCLVHFRAQIIFDGVRDHTVRRAVARAAGALAAFVHNNRLGVAWGGGVVLDAGPDEFTPAASQLDVWAVEWAHRADLGDWFETEEGETPSQVFVSWDDGATTEEVTP